MRNHALRNDAPRARQLTMAAVVPAQYALSSSSQNATYSAERQTAAQRRRPNRTAGRADRSPFARLSILSETADGVISIDSRMLPYLGGGDFLAYPEHTAESEHDDLVKARSCVGFTRRASITAAAPPVLPYPHPELCDRTSGGAASLRIDRRNLLIGLCRDPSAVTTPARKLSPFSRHQNVLLARYLLIVELL